MRLEHVSSGAFALVTTALRVVGVALYGASLAVWSGSRVEIYEFDASEEPRTDPRMVGSFDSLARCAALWDDHIYLCVSNRIEVANYVGSVQSSMGLSDAEGEPCAVAIAGTTRSGGGESFFYMQREIQIVR